MKCKKQLKKFCFLLCEILLAVMLSGCDGQQEGDSLKDGSKIISDETVSLIHEQSEAVISETATASGVRAKLTELKPFILYISASDGNITQLYDVYKATFTASSGYQAERYMVAYYRNVEIQNPETKEPVMKSETPVCVGTMVEAAATSQEGGFIFGYKSRQEMEADVLRSMDTGITHQIEEK